MEHVADPENIKHYSSRITWLSKLVESLFDK